MGIGGLIHSLIDYNLAYFVAGALSKQFDIRSFSSAKKTITRKKKTSPFLELDNKYKA